MHKTILIGFDGATFTVLDPLLAAGHMPCLKRFLDEGVRAELLSTPHPLTPPAWTTLITGRSPGQHGVFDFMRSDVRGDRAFFTLTNFRDIRCETLWALVSRCGGRIISLNFPLHAPPPAVAGSIVPGLLSWRHLRRNVYPPELYQEMRSLPGFDLREFSCEIEMITSGPTMPEEELIPWVHRHVIAKDRHWFQVLRHLMQTDPAALTGVIFDGVDKIQHVCWRFLDPEYLPAQPNAVERQLRDLCLEYFRQLDSFVGEILELAGPDANVLIASDHGFGPCMRSFRVNKWLEQQGLLRWPTTPPRGGPAKNVHFVHLDWEHTSVFAPSASTNGIHIRIRQGPDGPGIPAEQYHAVRDRLVAQLRALQDPFTGRPYLKDVLTREQAFPGVHQDKAPDLTVVPRDHGIVSVLNTEPIIAERRVTGTHYPVGILLGRGPALAKGRIIPRQRILDVAPTLLYSLGMPIPADFEGGVIDDLLDPSYVKGHPVQSGPPTEAPPGYQKAHTAEPAEPVFTAAEEEGILERLRSLGYVE